MSSSHHFSLTLAKLAIASVAVASIVTSSYAATIQVESITTWKNITCSDSSRAYVYKSLSTGLAKIELVAAQSETAAEKSVAKLDAVIAKSTILAKSSKYASPAHQCVLAFIVQATAESKERITGDKLLSDAWSATESGATSTSQPATIAVPSGTTIQNIPKSIVSNPPTQPQPTTDTWTTPVVETPTYSNPKEASVRRVDELSKMMSCRGTEELIAPWTSSRWGRDWMTSDISCDANSWNEANGRALVQNRCDGTSNFNVTFDAKTKGSWVKGNSITFGSNGIAEYNIVAGSVEAASCSLGKIDYRCSVTAIRCDAN